jgi:thiol:disulfide interchange protein DsbD
MKRILLLLLVTFVYSFSSTAFAQKFLEPNEAFKPIFLKSKNSLDFKLELGTNIYLYDDKIKVFINNPQKIEITKELNIPKAVAYQEFMVHFDVLNLSIPYELLKSKVDLKEYEIEVKFQGCSKEGLCYAPIGEKYKLTLEDSKLKNETVEIKKEALESTNLNETDLIANSLKNNNLLLVLATFFGFGLLLSLTPCVFPMIPILSSIIVGASKNESMTATKGFLLSLVYVLSMSVAYTIAGIIAGIFGANLQVSTGRTSG